MYFQNSHLKIITYAIKILTAVLEHTYLDISARHKRWHLSFKEKKKKSNTIIIQLLKQNRTISHFTDRIFLFGFPFLPRTVEQVESFSKTKSQFDTTSNQNTISVFHFARTIWPRTKAWPDHAHFTWVPLPTPHNPSSQTGLPFLSCSLVCSCQHP